MVRKKLHRDAGLTLSSISSYACKHYPSHFGIQKEIENWNWKLKLLCFNPIYRATYIFREMEFYYCLGDHEDNRWYLWGAIVGSVVEEWRVRVTCTLRCSNRWIENRLAMWNFIRGECKEQNLFYWTTTVSWRSQFKNIIAQ